MRAVVVPVLIGVLALGGCTSDPAPGDPTSRSSGPSSPTAAPTPESGSESGTGSEPAPDLEPAPRVRADDARVRTAVRAVAHLAGTVGPRPGTSPAYHRAARWVARRLGAHGWAVERQPFPTPAGSYEGAALAGGRSVNVVATRGDVRPGRPWLLVGAHLDTVPRAPGAEDNASGVGVLLAVAEALEGRRARLPVVLVAFGSEEPRGDPEDHHYGSRAYVASLTAAERRSLRGMVSLDRVGVGAVLPVGSAQGTDPVQRALLAAAARVGVPTVEDPLQRSSDHWSFAREGLPGARLGSTPYAAYHSAADVPAVVQPAQLRRTARTVLAWLR